MSDSLSLDLKYDTGGPVERELSSLASAMACLYWEASRKWPGRSVSQKYGAATDGVFTVELRPLMDKPEFKG